MMWNGVCSCAAQQYICSLKPCGGKMYAQLVKNKCYCMWRKPYCESKACPSGMRGSWSVMKNGKDSCRCSYTQSGCN